MGRQLGVDHGVHDLAQPSTGVLRHGIAQRHQQCLGAQVQADAGQVLFAGEVFIKSA
jgi:hypothetical protein